MADYQRVVDDIRSLLQSSDQQLTDHVKQLAGLYATACQAANQRLSRCNDFLNKGLRSEAIHLAQADPILLDVVAALDFPERLRWEELCVVYGLASAPPLNLETARALNEAYADDQPVEELLRKHRLLALGRAPLYSRLSLLRRIAELDAGNALWSEDVKEFERARLQQITDGVDVLVRSGSADGLRAAEEELTRGKWLVIPPAHLVSRVQIAVRGLNQKNTLVALHHLEAQLREAMNAYDVVRTRQLGADWNKLVTPFRDNIPNPNDPLWRSAQAVFDWLGEQERRNALEESYQQAVTKLEAALNAGASKLELESLAQDVDKFQRGVPEPVAQRYQARQASLLSAARRKRWLIGAAAAAGVLAAAGGMFGWLNHRAAEQRVTSAVAAIEPLLGGQRLDEAATILDNLAHSDPATAQHPNILQLAARLKSEQKRDDERKASFHQVLEKARAAPTTAEGELLLQEAEQLARRPAEREAIARLKDERGLFASERDKEILTQLEALRGQVDRVAEMMDRTTDFTEVTSRLNEQIGAAGQLATAAAAASHKTQDEVTRLQRRLDALRAKVGDSTFESLVLTNMTRALNDDKDLGPYVQQAKRYIDKYPDSPRAKDFQRVVEERPLWQAVLEWNQFVRAAGDKPLQLRLKDAAAPLESCRSFLQHHPLAPDRALMETYIECLEAVLQRDEKAAKSAVTEFRNTFKLVYVKDVWYLKLTDGRTYYANEDFEPKVKQSTGDFVRVAYLTGFDGQTKQGGIKSKTISGSRGRTGQSLIAEQVGYLPENFVDKNWEETILGVAQKIRDAKEMDPFLKFFLLKRVLHSSARGSRLLKTALAACLDGIDKAEVDLTLPWMDPENKEAAKQRPQVREIIDKLPRFDPVLKAFAEERQALEDKLTLRVPVGMLLRAKSGGWYCQATAPVPMGELFVLLPSSDKTGTWQSIGKKSVSGMSIQSEAPESLSEGRPVFAFKSRTR